MQKEPSRFRSRLYFHSWLLPAAHAAAHAHHTVAGHPHAHHTVSISTIGHLLFHPGNLLVGLSLSNPTPLDLLGEHLGSGHRYLPI